MSPFQRIIGAIVLAGVVGAAIGVPYFTGGGGPAATAYFVSTTGSDSNNCTSAATPCASFNGVVAQTPPPGSVVSVASGSYPAQNIAQNASITAANGYSCNPQTTETIDAAAGFISGSVFTVPTGCIHFEPAPGASVTLASLTDYVPNVSNNPSGFMWFTGMTVTGSISAGSGSCGNTVPTDLYFEDMTAPEINFDSAANVAVVGGSYGDGAAVTVSVAHACSGGVNVSHLLIANTAMHDVVQTCAGGTCGVTQHLECIHLTGADYVTIAGTSLTNCAQHDILLSSVGNETHILLENNLLAHPCSNQITVANGGQCDLDNPVDLGCSSTSTIGPVVVRFNSANGEIAWADVSPCAYATPSLDMGNIDSIPTGSCHTTSGVSGVTSDYDASWGFTCGAHSVNLGASAPFVNAAPSAYDFHVTSCAIASANLVPTSAAAGIPATDYAGVTRPQGTNADAGAYEDCS